MTPDPTSLFEMQPEEYRILGDDSKKQPYQRYRNLLAYLSTGSDSGVGPNDGHGVDQKSWDTDS
jgi:hypothetical protein